jgi:hypothetical protein
VFSSSRGQQLLGFTILTLPHSLHR